MVFCNLTIICHTTGPNEFVDCHISLFFAKILTICRNIYYLYVNINLMTDMDVNELTDSIDRKILKIITLNARVPFKDVAEQVGISRTSVHQRVQRMTDIGVIKSSGFHVNPQKLGFNMCVYVGITLERGSLYNSVVSELEKIPEIVESQYTLGAYTILIKLYARDANHLMELLNGRIQEIPGVINTETLTSLDQRIKRSVPIED